MEETTVVKEEEVKKGGTFSMLPAGVQVLIDWVIFLVATLVSFFKKKESD